MAWGFTNSEGDWVDVVIVENDPDDKDSYLTPDGPRKFEHHARNHQGQRRRRTRSSTSSRRSGDRSSITITKGRPRVIRWVAHDTDGVNMGLMRMESAKTLEDALRVGQSQRLAGTELCRGRRPGPHCLDDPGPHSAARGLRRPVAHFLGRRLAPLGRLPDARGISAGHRSRGRTDLDGQCPRGRAARCSAKLGDGGYDLGARAEQIRDDLLAIEKASEADMLRIQLDDRAVFLERWQKLLLETLTPEAVEADPRRGELRKLVDELGRPGGGRLGGVSRGAQVSPQADRAAFGSCW